MMTEVKEQVKTLQGCDGVAAAQFENEIMTFQPTNVASFGPANDSQLPTPENDFLKNWLIMRKTCMMVGQVGWLGLNLTQDTLKLSL